MSEKRAKAVIRRVRIQNFRALKDVSVELRPLTVLVGPNDSGKTSFLEAIYRKLSSVSSDEDFWRGSNQPQVDLLTKQRSPFQGTVEIFKLPSEGIPMTSAGVAEIPGAGAPQLAVSGENLAAFLDYLLRKDRKRFDQVQVTLRSLVPGLEEISITTPSADRRSVELTIEGGFEISGERLSTGVRMLFFFVALAHHPNPPHVALIEEPENGVHPQRLKDIVGLLRGLTRGELAGRAVQVVLTTHSPYLLDHVALPQDQVIVFRREDDGTRSAREVDEQRLKAFLDEFMLGEVWFNQGEEGLLASTG
jgi:predicted ATPase